MTTATTPASRFLQFAEEAGLGQSHRRQMAGLCRFLASDLGAHRITLYVRGEDGFVPYVSEFSTGEVDRLMAARWYHLNPAAAVEQLLDGRRTTFVPDPGETFPSVTAEWDVQPFLATALGNVDDPAGLLVIEGDGDALDRTVRLLDEIRAFVTLAVDLIRASASDQLHAAEAEALFDVTVALSRSTELGPVLAAVAQATARVTGFPRGSIFLIDETGSLQASMSQYADGHTDPEAWEKFKTIKADLPAATAVIESGRPAAYDDPRLVPELIPPQWLQAFDIESVLFVPLVAWERPFGVLVLDMPRRRHITDREIRIAGAVAGQGAVAVGMARLLDRERSSRQRAVRASAQLAGKERQQAAVADLGMAALGERDIVPFMAKAVRTVAATLDADFCEILELDEPRQEFVLLAAAGLPPSMTGLEVIPNDDTTQAGYTIQVSRPVVMADLDVETRFYPPDNFIKHGIVSGVSVPIGTSDHPYGVLGVHTTTRREFAASEVSFLQSVANIVASAVDRTRTEAALAQSRHRFQAILDTASDAIVSTDSTERIVLFNRAAETMFGYTADDVIGRRPEMLLPTGRRGGSSIVGTAAADGSGPTRQIQIAGVRRDGTRFPAAVTVSKLDLDGDVTFTAIVRDITEQQLAQEKLEHLVESKGELIASVSHELRTPLTGILGFVELLRDRRHEYSADEQQAMISAAAAEAADLSNIVDDLLAAARAEMGTLDVATVRVDLTAQVAQVLESRDEFRRVSAFGKRIRVVADPGRVRQILRNLLTNAMRYGGSSVAVETAARGGCGVVRVVDDGAGIPAGDRARVFEPFERSEGRPGLPGSVGLGLSVSRNLARLMGGDLTYRYRAGRSVFELELPAA